MVRLVTIFDRKKFHKDLERASAKILHDYNYRLKLGGDGSAKLLAFRGDVELTPKTMDPFSKARLLAIVLSTMGVEPIVMVAHSTNKHSVGIVKLVDGVFSITYLVPEEYDGGVRQQPWFAAMELDDELDLAVSFLQYQKEVMCHSNVVGEQLRTIFSSSSSK